MIRTFLCFVCLWTTAGSLMAQDPDAKRILTKYNVMRPTDKELAMYRLDWAESLEQALKWAARERRPIFLIIIHAKYGDIISGHC